MRSTYRGAWTGAVVASVGMLGMVGCAGLPAHVSRKGVTCIEAQQVVTAAVQRMGYVIDSATKPTVAAPGVILATRTYRDSPRKMTARVVCGPYGTEIEAKIDESGLAALDFPTQFESAYSAAERYRSERRRGQTSGLDVVMVPQWSTGTDGFGIDISDTGFLPVSLQFANHGTHNYQFRVAEVVLQTTDGENVQASAIADVVKSLDATKAAAVRAKMLSDCDVRAAQTVTGYLYFPFKPYVKGRVSLLDQKYEEPEGFSINFW